MNRNFKDLKRVVEKENKGLDAWAKRWGAVLALFIAFFAVPRGVVDAYHVCRSRPNTELVGGSVLVMGYDPASRKISFAVDFGAANTGTKDDVVRDLKGNLKNVSIPEANLLPFGIPDIDCSPQGAKVDLPSPIRTAASTSIACTFASQLREPTAGPLARGGSYRLVMNLSGLAKESQTLEFCFNLNDKDLAEFLGSAKMESVKFWYPDCDQTSGQILLVSPLSFPRYHPDGKNCHSCVTLS